MEKKNTPIFKYLVCTRFKKKAHLLEFLSNRLELFLPFFDAYPRILRYNTLIIKEVWINVKPGTRTCDLGERDQSTSQENVLERRDIHDYTYVGV